MKIILKGKPGIGKSTILRRFHEKYPDTQYGIIIERMKDEEGFNHGFEAVSLDGKKRIIAHRDLIKSNIVIGNGHNVDIEAIDSFIVSEILKGLADKKSIILIDEIGRMQSFSKLFLNTIKDVLSSECNFLATIIDDPEPWSLEFKEDEGVVLVEVTKENRDILPDILNLIFSTKEIQLNQRQRYLINELLRGYFNNEQYTQIRKLYNNAIPYVLDNKVTQENEGYKVSGNNANHLVKDERGNYMCDCDLFKGIGQYLNNPGVCSHIQAVILFELN